jgi:ubiquinone/menaquinone biosynthesis C-methylase UbiE
MRLCLQCHGTCGSGGWLCTACGAAPLERGGIVYFAPTLAAGDGGDATYQHEALLAAERSHFWFRGRAQLLVWALQRHFPRLTTLLDVGCGRGALLEAVHRKFPRVALAGGELLDGGLQLARPRLNGVDLYQIDARALPFDREFDVVTSCDVLEHIDDHQAVAHEFFRAVVPGGGIIITVPQHQWLWSAVDTYSHHRRRYQRHELVSIVEQAGFVVERVTSFMTALLPVVLLSRIRQQQLDERFDPTAELKIGAVANTLFGTALDVERMVIRAGASLPFGSSLLLVARRPER